MRIVQAAADVERSEANCTTRVMASQVVQSSSENDSQVAFRSLTENMDTTSASGELLFNVFASLAQYERALVQERVTAGLAAARRRGRIGGRPPAIAGEKLEAILAALNGGMSKAAVCRSFGVKRTTLIDTLARIGPGMPESAASP